MGRHYGMDWLRIGAFGLLILYHIGMVFVPWNYHVKTAQTLDWVQVPMQAVNAWRLFLLFVVSGYASRAIFAGHRAPGDFAWARTLRLMIPTIAAILVVVPPQPWVELVTKHGYAHSFLHFWVHDYFRFGALHALILPNWQHLWFVVYLWVYTLVLALALAILPARAKALAARLADFGLGGVLILLVPAALLIGHWAWTFPGARETHGLIDDGPIHRIYAAMFLFGFHLRESPALWRAIRRWWPVAAALALAAYAVVASIEIAYLGPPRMSRTLWFVFGVARAVQSWCAIIALIGMADRWLNHDHPIRKMLNEAIFPFYIIHQTIIVVVQGELLRYGLHPAAEFAILLAATAVGCWGFYALGRRIFWVRPLIGLKMASAPARPATFA